MSDNPVFSNADTYQAVTHKVENQSPELCDYNLYEQDIALQESVEREGAHWADDQLKTFGDKIGQQAYLELGADANSYKPRLITHDRHGHRIDKVKFHPAYHQLMKTAIETGLHSSPWTDPKPGAHVARCASYYLHTQTEQAHGCPITMTFASIPTLLMQPNLAAIWVPKVTAREYDPRNIGAEQKNSVTVGMAMTEKQGGSDVRLNSTKAFPIGGGGSGQLYELVGHKYFVSAPMCDAFLVLAKAPNGLSCFLLPRWRPDGSKNPIQIQRLKDKMGNVANASCETELRGALAWMIGEEGRGIRTIIEMVSLTRYDCMIGSTATMRMAASQAMNRCHYRSAFGAKLIDQPVMQNVLADLVLEQEAALSQTFRMAKALDNQDNEQERLLMRLGTAVGKYWICKRTPNHTYEAMECLGGSGVMEDSIMPRLFRESPVNSIWEGSGNVQCLDVLRAMKKTPAVVDVFFHEISQAKGAHRSFDHFIGALQKDLNNLDDLEYRARNIVDRLALAIQASLLIRNGNNMISDAFCASRLEYNGALNYGTLPQGINCKKIIERARPKLGV